MSYRGYSIYTDQRLNDEIARAKLAEQQLATDLASEVANRQNAILAEQSARETAIVAEKLRAESAEQQLATDLASEVVNRQNAILAEQSARQSAVNELDGRIEFLETWRTENTDEISGQIDKMLNERITTDAVNGIVAQLESVDSSLNEALLNAVTERKSQDALHQLDLNDIYEYLQLHSKTYKIEDIVSSASDRAVAIKADGQAPVSSVLGGWDYTKSPTHQFPKINWYFYGDTTKEKNQSFGSMECFYVKMVVPTGVDPVWITAYSHTQGDGNDGASWYRSRWNMAGYYEEGGINVPREQEIVMYFSPQGKTPREVFTHLAPMPQLDLLTHNASAVEYLNRGPRDNAEILNLIALSSDSSSSTTSVLVKEVGFKFANRLPRVLTLQ